MTNEHQVAIVYNPADAFYQASLIAQLLVVGGRIDFSIQPQERGNALIVHAFVPDIAQAQATFGRQLVTERPDTSSARRLHPQRVLK